MQIVTLTTDLGEQDYALPALKGCLLQKAAPLLLADVTHQVQNFDIVQAAFILSNVWKHYPAGTIHLVWVNNYYAPQRDFLVISHQEHYFIGPDNGVFSLVLGAAPEQAFRLEYEDNDAFSLRELYAFAVAHIAGGQPLEKVGLPTGSILQRITFQPVTGPSHIRGTVIHVDNFENVVLNISRSLFDAVGQGRSFSLHYKRHEPITQLSQHYAEAPVGEPLCLFNASGYLEIAVYMGKAASLLGLVQEDMVEVLFEG
ncbi:MAG: SAM-dependent chlorinase/fluorinase [Saprospiraceae bacterium]|nr:SAM-dependent chlorinase/fluorinase [Saprospiraceae bacterium]